MGRDKHPITHTSPSTTIVVVVRVAVGVTVTTAIVIAITTATTVATAATLTTATATAITIAISITLLKPTMTFVTMASMTAGVPAVLLIAYTLRFPLPLVRFSDSSFPIIARYSS